MCPNYACNLQLDVIDIVCCLRLFSSGKSKEVNTSVFNMMMNVSSYCSLIFSERYVTELATYVNLTSLSHEHLKFL